MRLYSRSPERVFLTHFFGRADPSGSMAIIDYLTDNPNLTFGDVRQRLPKPNVKLAAKSASATCSIT